MRLLENLKLPVWLVLTFYWIALISSTWVTQTLALHLSTTSLLLSPIFGWASLMAQTVKNLPAMQEIRVRFLGQEDPLEKEMVTHSSILAWKISWTEEPGGLQSMGLQRVRQD